MNFHFMKLIRKLGNAYRLFNKNRPVFVGRFRAEIKRNICRPPQSQNLKLGDVVFPFDLALGPHMEKMYFGDYGLEIAVLLKKFLKPGMTFLDVGANVGYFSALALNLVGTTGLVVSFEPVPTFADRLKTMVALNPRYRILCNDYGLGEREDTVEISICGNDNIGWNTMVPDFMAAAEISKTASVRIRRLDHYLSEERINQVDLIKIDVEGYEFPVLQGAKNFLEKTKPIIISEIAPAAYSKLHTSLMELQIYMNQFGYRTYDSTLRPMSLTA